MKIALAQMRVEFENKKKNMETCLTFLKQAKENSCDLIVFPEMTLTGFSMNTSITAEDNNETTEWFKDQACIYNLYIGFGHVVRQESLCKNKFTIISPKGEQILSYTKIHPFSYSFEDKYYEGGTEILYSKIKDFIVSSFICYDLRFPEIFQIASKKSSLIVVAANWPKSRRDNWITLVKARAIENQCYIAAINVTGIINNIEYSGDSLIVDPIGNILASAQNEERLIISDIDQNEVMRYRTHFPIKNDRRESLYKSIIAKKQG